jgi:F0F1-type ATP synthase assembly protein I
MTDDNNKDTFRVDKYGTFADAEKIRQELNTLPIQNVDTDIKVTKKIHNSQDAAKGLAASSHIVSGVVVGGLLGYGLDILCHSVPIFTAIMIPVGMIAGFRNMIRTLDSDDKNRNADK